VNGLAEELGLAPATIRRHLDILQRDGLVTFTEIRHGTGRPEFSFSLTEHGHETLPKHYSEMLGQLVSKLISLDSDSIDGRSGKQVLDEILRDMAQDSVERRGDVGAGIPRLIEILREQDFTPEVTRERGKLTLSLMSCPYRSVAIQNPELCSYDTAVISTVTGLPMERIACLTDGDPFCRYVIGDGSGNDITAR
jgi:predicted ArsR family transcriptional regulator